MGQHFVLVHGACHGAWCWYKVATLLRSEGHKVTALDLAASGVNSLQIEDVCSLSDYVKPLMDFMPTIPAEEKVVLVGHSMGGVAVSVAMENFPHKVAVAVFATAFMFGPDSDFLTVTEKMEKKLDSFMDSQLKFDQGSDKRPTSVLFGPKMLETKFYQLSPTEDLTLATMLVKPHPSNTDEKSLGGVRVTKDRYGSVRRVYVVADQDIIIPEEIQRWMIEVNPPDEVKVINGSDHMIMLSKPKELCSCLEAIAQQYY